MQTIHQNNNEPQNRGSLETDMINEFERFKTLPAAAQKRVLQTFDSMIETEADSETKSFLTEIKNLFAGYAGK